jgi:chromosome segregation ATPase
MTELNDRKAAPAAPPAHVGTTLFWTIAGVLLLGVVAVYFIADAKIQGQNDDLRKVIAENYSAQTKERDAALAKQEAVLKQELALMGEENAKLKAANGELKGVVTDVSKRFAAFIDKQYHDEKQKLDNDVSMLTTGLTSTNEHVAKTERDVKYMQDNLATITERLKGVDSSIASLTSIGADLKSEQAALLKDLATVKSQGGDTSVALQKLNDRSRLFELKVMAERAKQAAVAAESGNYAEVFKNLNMKPVP